MQKSKKVRDFLVDLSPMVVTYLEDNFLDVFVPHPSHISADFTNHFRALTSPLQGTRPSMPSIEIY